MKMKGLLRMKDCGHRTHHGSGAKGGTFDREPQGSEAPFLVLGSLNKGPLVQGRNKEMARFVTLQRASAIVEASRTTVDGKR